MIIGQEMVFSDGSSLRVYDTGAGSADDQVTVFWHHGTPNIGLPPEPLFAAADRLESALGRLTTGPVTAVGRRSWTVTSPQPLPM